MGVGAVTQGSATRGAEATSWGMAAPLEMSPLADAGFWASASALAARMRSQRAFRVAEMRDRVSWLTLLTLSLKAGSVVSPLADAGRSSWADFPAGPGVSSPGAAFLAAASAMAARALAK